MLRRTFACQLVILLAVASAGAADRPVKVFILAGQSNMEGKGKVSLLEYQIEQPETKKLFQHLRKGGLTVGFGSPGRIGPELEFGNTVGDHYDQQVLIIKTAWGGRSLYRDFRSPSSGRPANDVLKPMLEKAQKKKPETTLADIKAKYGASYRAMLEEISSTLKNLKEHFPDYTGEGYEIAGFVWFQGWNDMISAQYTAEYAGHMANFIRDVRKDLKAPKLPFVIGQLGVGGLEEASNEKKKAFKDAQAAPAEFPEFKGNVAVVKTDQYWDVEAAAVYAKGWKKHLDEWNKVGSDYPFHYLGSVKTFNRIGKAFAQAILKLSEKKK